MTQLQFITVSVQPLSENKTCCTVLISWYESSKKAIFAQNFKTVLQKFISLCTLLVIWNMQTHTNTHPQTETHINKRERNGESEWQRIQTRRDRESYTILHYNTLCIKSILWNLNRNVSPSLATLFAPLTLWTEGNNKRLRRCAVQFIDRLLCCGRVGKRYS